MAHTYIEEFKVDHTKVVNSSLTAFPVVVAGTFTWAKDIAHGGRMVNGNSGFDGRPYSDSSGSTALAYKTIKWDLTTGDIVVVVKLDINPTTDVSIYFGVGDSALNTDGSSTSAWKSTFAASYHGSATDLTSNGKNLTPTGSPGTTAGNIGDAITLNGTTQYLTTSSLPVTGLPFTITALIRQATIAGGALAGFGNFASGGIILEATPQTGGAHRTTDLGANATTAGSLRTANTWDYIASRLISTTSRFAHVNTTAGTQSTATSTNSGTADTFYVGARRSGGTTNNFFTGDLNVLRVYNVDPGADWISTESNSLRSPSTFAPYIGETAVGGGNTNPVADITGPVTSGATTVVQGSNVNFTGTGTDAEDGTLTGSALAWSSSIDGALGTGTSITVSTLSLGVHTITLTVTDSASATGTDTITVTVISVVRNANETFASANGGATKWKRMYDYREGVTNVSGAASQWDDVRANGATPLTQATSAQRPTITGGGLVFAASSSQKMIAALDTALNLDTTGTLTVMAVLKSPSGSAFPVVLSEDPTDTTQRPYMAIGTNASHYTGQYNPTASSTTNQGVMDAGTVFNDGLIRGVRITKRTTFPSLVATGDHAYEVQVAGAPTRRKLAGNPIADATASGMKLGVGVFGTTHADCTILWIGVTTQDHSQAFRESWYSFITTEFGATLDSAKRLVVWDDDSFVRGHNTTHPHGINGTDDGTTSPPYVMANVAPTIASMGYEDDQDAINMGSNGRGIPDAVGMFSVHVGADPDTRRPGRNVLITSPMINSFNLTYTNAGDATTAITDFTNYIASCVAAGWKVVIYTVMDSHVWYTPDGTGSLNQKGTNAVAMNTWMRSTGVGLTGVIGLIDWDALDPTLLRFKIDRAAQNPSIGTNANQDTTYYIPVNTHPTDTGAALMGTLARVYLDTNDILWTDVTSSVALPLSGSAASSVAVQASSSVAVPLGGTITELVSVIAASNVPLPLDGAATTAIEVTGTSTQALPLSGQIDTAVSIVATTSQPLPLGGQIDVTGAIFSIADSVQPLPLGGSASALVAVAAQSASAVPLAGSASTIVDVTAQSTVALPLSGAVSVAVSTIISSIVALPLGGQITVITQGLHTVYGVVTGLLPDNGTLSLIPDR